MTSLSTEGLSTLSMNCQVIKCTSLRILYILSLICTALVILMKFSCKLMLPQMKRWNFFNLFFGAYYTITPHQTQFNSSHTFFSKHREAPSVV